MKRPTTYGLIGYNQHPRDIRKAKSKCWTSLRQSLKKNRHKFAGWHTKPHEEVRPAQRPGRVDVLVTCRVWEV